MDIRISGKNFEVTAGMKEHLQEKLLKLDKYAPRIIEAHVILKKEKYLYVAEVTLLGKNLRPYGEASSKENIFTAMDQACVKIEKQLKKFREKVKSHHKGNFKEARKEKEVLLGVSEGDEPQVIRSRSFAAKPMSIEEANMQFKLSTKPFLVFKNSSTQKVNVMFKREDGNHGLVEPEF